MVQFSPDDVDALRLAVIRLDRKLRKSAGAGGVTPSQLSALFALGRHGPFRLGELARREQLSTSTVTRLVATLEAKGLLERTRDERDARSMIVEISDRGRVLLDAMAEGSNDYLRTRLAAMTPGDRARILGAVEALTQLAERP